MLIVKDAVVLIHLAKTSLLEVSCDHFGITCIPPEVQQEVDTDHPDAFIIRALIKNGKIQVRKLQTRAHLARAHDLNIHRGEAAAVALCWELGADMLATDDDNVRRKRDLFGFQVIGTPVIILRLYQEKKIDKRKVLETVKTMRAIGWFNQTIWDKIVLEVTRNG